MSETNEVKRSFWQFVKFAIVGVMNTLVDFLVYTVLTLVFGTGNDSVLLLGLFTLIAYACGVLNSFILNTHWTFKSEYRQTSRERWMFIAVNVVSWLVSYGLTYVFREYVFSGSELVFKIATMLHYTSSDQITKIVNILAKLLSAPAVIIVNFLASKLLVFTGKGEEK